MKTSKSTKFITKLKKSGVKIDDNSKEKYVGRIKLDGKDKVNDNEFEENKILEGKNYQKISKAKKLS